MNESTLRRGAVSISPLVIILLLGLIGLVAWKLGIYASRIPANYPGGSTLLSKQITSHVVAVLVIAAIAGGAAALGYFVSGRRDLWANLSAGLVLVLGVGVFAVQLFRYYSGSLPTPAPASTGTMGITPATSPPSSSLSTAADRQRQLIQEQSQRLREQAERMRPGTGSSLTPAPGPTLPTPANESLRGAPSSSTPTQPTAPQRDPADPALERAVAELERELETRIKEFVDAADAQVELLVKPPKALRSDLESRASATTKGKAATASLETYLRTFDAQADRQLTAAAGGAGAAVRAKVELSLRARTGQRAFALNAYSRLFDAGGDEASLLLDNVGKWRVDSTGSPTSTDRRLDGRLRSARGRVTAQASAIPAARSELSSDLAPSR